MYHSQDYRTGYTIMFRFLTCVWSRRLWTLQEAILLKKLYVVFSDGLAELSSIFTDVLQGTDDPLTEEALKSLAELTELSVDEVRNANEICRKIPSNTIHSLFLRELRSIPYLTCMKLQISQLPRCWPYATPLNERMNYSQSLLFSEEMSPSLSTCPARTVLRNFGCKLARYPRI